MEESFGRYFGKGTGRDGLGKRRVMESGEGENLCLEGLFFGW